MSTMDRMGAKTKVSDDQPTQQPMRAGVKAPRNPSTDQKKIRHQLARQASSGFPEGSTEDHAYNVGLFDGSSGIEFSLLWDDGQPFNDDEQRAYIKGYQEATPQYGPPSILAAHGSMSMDAAFEELTKVADINNPSGYHPTGKMVDPMPCDVCGKPVHFEVWQTDKGPFTTLVCTDPGAGSDLFGVYCADHFRKSTTATRKTAELSDEQTTDLAVDWLLRLRELQRQGYGFDEALAIANREAEEIAHEGALHTAGDPDEPTNLDPEQSGWTNGDDQEYNDGEWTMAGPTDPPGPFDGHTTVASIDLDPIPLIARTASAFLSRKES